MLILSYTLQKVMPNVFIKFDVLGTLVPKRSLREKNLHTHHTCHQLLTEICEILQIFRGDLHSDR